MQKASDDEEARKKVEEAREARRQADLAQQAEERKKTAVTMQYGPQDNLKKKTKKNKKKKKTGQPNTSLNFLLNYLFFCLNPSWLRQIRGRAGARGASCAAASPHRAGARAHSRHRPAQAAAVARPRA